LHRDVSPQNILVGIDGTARVIDFGIALAHRRRAEATTTGIVKGKARYMAPEQVVGDKLSPRTDVYAAGLVLLEMLAGPLFPQRGMDDDLLASRIAGLEGMPEPIRVALQRALEREPDDRFASALDFATALDAHPAASAPRVAKWVSEIAAERLGRRAEMVRSFEQSQVDVATRPPAPPRPAPSGDAAWTATDRASERRRSKTLVPFAIAGLLAVMITVIVIVQRNEKVVGPAAAATEHPGATEHPAATDNTSSSSANIPTPASAEPSPTVIASASASAPPSAASSAPHADSPPAKPPRPVSSPTTSAPAVDCSNPFVVDAQGVKRVRRECLGR
jgi:serine/threonine-protein kinase